MAQQPGICMMIWQSFQPFQQRFKLGHIIVQVDTGGDAVYAAHVVNEIGLILLSLKEVLLELGLGDMKKVGRLLQSRRIPQAFDDLFTRDATGMIDQEKAQLAGLLTIPAGDVPSIDEHLSPSKTENIQN